MKSASRNGVGVFLPGDSLTVTKSAGRFTDYQQICQFWANFSFKADRQMNTQVFHERQIMINSDCISASRNGGYICQQISWLSANLPAGMEGGYFCKQISWLSPNLQAEMGWGYFCQQISWLSPNLPAEMGCGVFLPADSLTVTKSAGRFTDCQQICQQKYSHFCRQICWQSVNLPVWNKFFL